MNVTHDFELQWLFLTIKVRINDRTNYIVLYRIGDEFIGNHIIFTQTDQLSLDYLINNNIIKAIKSKTPSRKYNMYRIILTQSEKLKLL
jgi:hypothetical protein